MASSKSKTSLRAQLSRLSVTEYSETFPIFNESVTVLGGSLSPAEIVKMYAKGKTLPPVGQPLPNDPVLRCLPAVRDKGEAFNEFNNFQKALVAHQEQQRKIAENPPKTPVEAVSTPEPTST